MAVLYALSILAWCAVARRFGTAAAVATAVGLLAVPGLRDALPPALDRRAVRGGVRVHARRSSPGCSSVRPSAARPRSAAPSRASSSSARRRQALLALALVPLLVAGRWRERLVRTAAFAAAALLPLAAWAVHNGVRFDDYTVARGGGTTVPFFRAFVVDRIVSPENGPASRELARAVADDLLAAGAVPLVRGHARRVLHVRQRPDARGRDRARRPDVGLGRRLRPRRRRRARGRAGASGDVRARRPRRPRRPAPRPAPAPRALRRRAGRRGSRRRPSPRRSS